MLDKRAHTLTEILVSSMIIVIFFMSAIGVFVMAKTFYASCMDGQQLQRDVNLVMDKMIKGMKEGGVRYGERSAVSFTAPIATITRLEFVGTDGQTRRYYLASGGIVYESPTQNPNVQTIYTTPANSAITLCFWQPAGYLDNQTVAIYLAVTKNVSGKTSVGSLATYINLRNL
ncbi:MAG: hypothetical protein WC522_06840 [Candidatus Omnitrophota bacterium]